MKFKKLVSVVLVAACVFSLAACGSDKKSEDKKVEVTKAEDLKDLTIGVQQGTTGDIYSTDDFGDDNVERFNKGMEAVQALQQGEIWRVLKS